MKSRSRILRGVAAKRVCISYVFHIRVVKTLDEFIIIIHLLESTDNLRLLNMFEDANLITRLTNKTQVVV